MSKLLSANIMRLRKDKAFWVCVFGSILFGAVCCLLAYQDMVKYHSIYTTDELLFRIFLLIGIMIAVFSSLYLGTEYSDGTIRNKLMVGHKRIHVYLTNCITVFLAGLFISMVYIMVVLIIGTPLFGFLTVDSKTLICYLLVSCLMILATSSLCCLLSMLNQSKAIVAVISILAVVACLVYVSYVFSNLNAPEYYSGYSFVDSAGVVQQGESYLNPGYLRSPEREIYEFISDFIPMGQGMQISGWQIARPLQMILCSVFITISSNVAGIFFFQRKDIK